jgi:hypothetical protein
MITCDNCHEPATAWVTYRSKRTGKVSPLGTVAMCEAHLQQERDLADLGLSMVDFDLSPIPEAQR